MSQLPIIGEPKTDENLILKMEIHLLKQGPAVNFFWNETWAATANPAWPQQVFLVALQSLWAAGLTILGNVKLPGTTIKTKPDS